MAKTKIGTTFLGPQKGLSIVGDHCMAYSGEVTVANNEVFLLDFFSPGKRYIIGEVQLGSKGAGNEDFDFEIYFNGLVVFSSKFENQASANIGPWPITLMIPPSTKVKMSLQNVVGSDARIWTVGLVGRVYA